jgi:hypothetical protein
MMSKKTAIELTRFSENLVYTSTDDIAQLIQLHAQLGMSEMEVFVSKDIVKKCVKALDKKKFYSKVIEFKSLQHECRLYVSWISNL